MSPYSFDMNVERMWHLLALLVIHQSGAPCQQLFNRHHLLSAASVLNYHQE